MSEKMVRFDVENETGDSHMVTMVTKDMYAVINLMNDYNLICKISNDHIINNPNCRWYEEKD